MGFGYDVYGILMGIVQIAIIALAGFILAKLGPLDRVGEKKAAQANDYLFIGLFSFVTIGFSIYSLSRLAIGLLLMSYFLSSLFAAIFAWLYCRFFHVDVRIIKVYILIAAFGNVVFIPESVVGAICRQYGSMENDPSCGMGVQYSMLLLLPFNVILLCIGPYFTESDKALTYNIRREMILVREFYPSVKDFLVDTDLSRVEMVQHNKYSELVQPAENLGPHEKIATSVNLLEGGKESTLKGKFMETRKEKIVLAQLEDPELIAYSLEVNFDTETFNKFETQFGMFIEKLNPKVFNVIYTEQFPDPVKSRELSTRFFINLLMSPPIIGCIAGVIIGVIPAVSRWLFGSWGLQAFMGTIRLLGNLAVPLAVVILGSQLVTGLRIGRCLNIRVIDIISMCVIRLILTPAVGLGFTAIMHVSGIQSLDNDNILLFSFFINWCVPIGILILTLFVLVDFYAKEGTLIVFWTTIFSFPSLVFFVWLYSLMFPF